MGGFFEEEPADGHADFLLKTLLAEHQQTVHQLFDQQYPAEEHQQTRGPASALAPQLLHSVYGVAQHKWIDLRHERSRLV